MISSDVIKPPSNEDIAVYRKIVEVREIEERAKLRRELLEFRLKVSIGSTAGIRGVATWRTEDRERFDQQDSKSIFPISTRNFGDRPIRRFCLE